MKGIRIRRASLVSGFLLALSAWVPASAQASDVVSMPNLNSAKVGVLGQPTPPDSTLFTTYSFYSSFTGITWLVCGSTKQSEGCYAGASLGTFGHAGALIEGNEVEDVLSAANPSAQVHTVTRKIFVVDDAAGEGTDVKLYVYTKTDAITSSTDTVTVTLSNTINLPLTGGAGVKTFMAANTNYLFIATNRGQGIAQISKSNLSLNQSVNSVLAAARKTNRPSTFDEIPDALSSITTDKYGFIAVTYGGVGNDSQFYILNPDGNGVEDGGGPEVLAGTQNAITASEVASNATSANLAARLKVHFKSSVGN